MPHSGSCDGLPPPPSSGRKSATNSLLHLAYMYCACVCRWPHPPDCPLLCGNCRVPLCCWQDLQGQRPYATELEVSVFHDAWFVGDEVQHWHAFVQHWPVPCVVVQVQTLNMLPPAAPALMSPPPPSITLLQLQLHPGWPCFGL